MRMCSIFVGRIQPSKRFLFFSISKVIMGSYFVIQQIVNLLGIKKWIKNILLRRSIFYYCEYGDFSYDDLVIKLWTKNETPNSFIHGLMTEDWTRFYGIVDTNVAFTYFINIFTFHFNIHLPLITRQSVKRNAKLISHYVRQSTTNLKNLHSLSRTFLELREYYNDQKRII